MNKKSVVLKTVISLSLLGLILTFSGCGTGIDMTDTVKVIEINQEEEAKRSALSIDQYVSRYPQAIQLLEDEKYFEALVILRNLANYKDGRELYNIALRKQSKISTGETHVLGLKKDGTVIAVGLNNLYGECNVEGMDKYEIIIEEKKDIYGIKQDGTRVFLGLNEFYEYNDYANKPKWNNIAAVCAGKAFSAGLKNDGTVVVIGADLPDVSNWGSIIAISGDNDCFAGLCGDGTVACDYSGLQEWMDIGESFEGLKEWKGIVGISSGGNHVLGLKKDGTVLAVGDNSHGQCNVQEWKNIVAVAAGGAFSVGLRCDGTVIATGMNNSGQCDLEDWNDIVVISSCGAITNGIKSDGTVVSTSFETDTWNDIVAITEVNHKDGKYCVGLKRDGTLVFTGDKWGRKHLWELGLESWEL